MLSSRFRVRNRNGNLELCNQENQENLECIKGLTIFLDTSMRIRVYKIERK